MEPKSSWDADSITAKQEIPRKLWNPKIQWSMHSTWSLDAILGHCNLFQLISFISNFCICHPKWSLSSFFSSQPRNSVLFYGSRKFISVTSSSHWSPPCVTLPTSDPPILFVVSILILSPRFNLIFK